MYFTVCVFQGAVLKITMRVLVQCMYMCVFTKPISWKLMRMVDEKQEIKLQWPNYSNVLSLQNCVYH